MSDHRIDAKRLIGHLVNLHPCPASWALDDWLNAQLQLLCPLALTEDTVIGLIEMEYLSLLLDLEVNRPEPISRSDHPYRSLTVGADPCPNVAPPKSVSRWRTT